MDSATETAREVKELLIKKGLVSGKRKDINHSFLVSDEPASFMNIGERFLGRKIGFVKKV